MTYKLYLCVIYILTFTSISNSKTSELKIIKLHKPSQCSAVAGIGDKVSVHYTGKLENGKVFDSSANRDPLPFVLGERKVIPGWEEGIMGMCIGEKRKLIIPPHLAYGSKGYPPTIPAEATLTFETELMDISKKPMEFDIMGTLSFFAVPAAVGLALYWVYDRYKKAPTKKDMREASRRRAAKRKH